jgi:hypothetical protein
MAVQCSGNTCLGIRCGRMTTLQSGRCNYHPFPVITTCSICLEEIVTKKIGSCSLIGCGHTFCQKCINLWICTQTTEPSCPTCRKKIDSLQVRTAGMWGYYKGLMVRVTVKKYDIKDIRPEDLPTSFFSFLISKKPGLIDSKFKKIFEKSFIDELNKNVTEEYLYYNKEQIKTEPQDIHIFNIEHIDITTVELN